jgi:GNAT superfamily N-acetyltransferase
MKIIKTNNSNSDFIDLTKQLDAELNKRYGVKRSEYDKHNLIDPIDTAIIGYLEKIPVACGCFKIFNNTTIEIKRMFVQTGHRRKGFSTIILQSLEEWGSDLGYLKAILETGKKQPEAIALYKNSGYQIIDNYGPYRGFKNSVCMEKFI